MWCGNSNIFLLQYSEHIFLLEHNENVLYRLSSQDFEQVVFAEEDDMSPTAFLCLAFLFLACTVTEAWTVWFEKNSNFIYLLKLGVTRSR